MDRLPTYNDFKKTSKIFEAHEIKNFTQAQINEAEAVYEEIVKKLENGEELEEGIISGLLGAGIGGLTGPIIMKGVCKALGIDLNGTLGKLLTSRLVATAVGYSLGK